MIDDEKQGSIMIIDAGGQYCHLIARRVREAGVRSIIRPGKIGVQDLAGVKGVIISGGPNSVYEPEAPEISDTILKANIPVLGLCYGHQYLAHRLGGIVSPGIHREYGEAVLEVMGKDTILTGLRKTERVWMSHGDEVTAAPQGFDVLARTASCRVAAMANLNRRIFGLQFHPEVHETERGQEIIENFLFKVCNCEKEWQPERLIDILRQKVVAAAKGRNVLFFVSGGVDSTVAFTLCTDALGPDHVKGVFVDTGLMREGERAEIEAAFKQRGWHNIKFENAENEFLKALKNVADPEEKRHIIGDCFLKVQQRLETELHLERENWMLGQGTIYPDTIESGGSNFAATIKTHHNRVPAIQKMLAEGRILEPIRDLYKDEVRNIGSILQLPQVIISKHPFPGPGLGVRCLCSTQEVPINTSEELQRITRAAELQGWTVPIATVGVQGDFRTYSNLVILNGRARVQKFTNVARQITRELKKTNRVAFVAALRQGAELGNARVIKRFIDKDRLNLLRKADAMCQEMLREEALPDLVWQFPVILVPLRVSTGETIALRPVTTQDFMTAKHSTLPISFIHKMAKRILRELPDIDMVLYDVTDKPPATIEWE